MRLLLDDAGAPVAPQAYSPFGVPTDSAPASFGFTGELHSQDTGLVYLRARWYDPSSGTFTSVDPFAGFPRQPYSLHPYQYAYSSPMVWADPSGLRVDPVPSLSQHVPQSSYSTPMTSQSSGISPCQFAMAPFLAGPQDIGYFEGGTLGYGFIGFVAGGSETVFDLYDFEAADFFIAGWGAQVSIGAEVTRYIGIVGGWSTYQEQRIENYAGLAVALTVGASFPVGGLGAGLTLFWSKKEKPGGQLWGATADVNGGLELEMPINVAAVVWTAWILEGSKRVYYDRLPNGDKRITRQHGMLFAADILIHGDFMPGLMWAAHIALRNAEAWERMHAHQP